MFTTKFSVTSAPTTTHLVTSVFTTQSSVTSVPTTNSSTTSYPDTIRSNVKPNTTDYRKGKGFEMNMYMFVIVFNVIGYIK